MNRNQRVIADLAKELKCHPEEIISYVPTKEAMSKKCGTCRYFQDNGTCDIGDGNPVNTTADTHSCGMYSSELRVCTCWDGYLCPFECESCPEFKIPEEKKTRKKK